MATEHSTQARQTIRHPAHEHGWITESAHRTSEGIVAYVACASCRARRIDLRGYDASVPEAQSLVVGAVGRMRP